MNGCIIKSPKTEKEVARHPPQASWSSSLCPPAASNAPWAKTLPTVDPLVPNRSRGHYGSRRPSTARHSRPRIDPMDLASNHDFQRRGRCHQCHVRPGATTGRSRDVDRCCSDGLVGNPFHCHGNRGWCSHCRPCGGHECGSRNVGRARIPLLPQHRKKQPSGGEAAERRPRKNGTVGGIS